ncbi:hypothetical protein HCC18_16725 [Listeria booriae]|uniref:hypothetical protein n=1 Tax=Listeria booriae TaxID=1552123 RepID=UPI00162806D2|nr:hypothetical protein [Listeria booriae]MBC2318491.1 hypothetical protein [Listeria booriae]MCD2205570.1 hypothetical protein [Listeria booriae]
MWIFTKERFQETLWLEGVGTIPEEAIQERLQLLHRQGLDKSYSQHLPKKKLPDLLFVRTCQYEAWKMVVISDGDTDSSLYSLLFQHQKLYRFTELEEN